MLTVHLHVNLILGLIHASLNDRLTLLVLHLLHEIGLEGLRRLRLHYFLLQVLLKMILLVLVPLSVDVD